MTQIIVYFVGVFALGIFYSSFKSATGGGFWFVVAAIAYLLALRLIGHGVAKLVHTRRRSVER